MLKKLAFTMAVLTSFSVSAQTIERPVVKVGNECHYDVFDNLQKDEQGNIQKIAERHGVVTSVEGNRITIKWTQKILVPRDTEDLEDRIWIYDRDLNVVERNGRKFDPPYPTRFYPLAPGMEKKEAKTNYPSRRGGGEISAQLDGKASNWEKLVVPAGSFDVIRIIWDGWYNVPSPPGRRLSNGQLYQEVALSPATWCQIYGVFKNQRGRGKENLRWSDHTYKLTGFKK